MSSLTLVFLLCYSCFVGFLALDCFSIIDNYWQTTCEEIKIANIRVAMYHVVSDWYAHASNDIHIVYIYLLIYT